MWDGCRALEEMFLANGARIGYWRGSIEGMIDDLQVCVPAHHLKGPSLIASLPDNTRLPTCEG